MQRNLRKRLLELLFLREFHECDEIEEQNQLYFDVVLPNEGIKNDNKEEVLEKYNKISDVLSEIDQRLSSEIQKWSFNRTGLVERNILRLCTYEIFYEQLPEAIAINEAVELAKEYGGTQSAGFINGVLAKIVKGKS